MQFYSSDADAAEWLASISGDYIPELRRWRRCARERRGRGSGRWRDAVIGEAETAEEGTVIEAPFGEESIG